MFSIWALNREWKQWFHTGEGAGYWNGRSSIIGYYSTECMAFNEKMAQELAGDKTTTYSVSLHTVLEPEDV